MENIINKDFENYVVIGLGRFGKSLATSLAEQGKDVFVKLGGYDGKNLPINEDMYIAYKLIQNDYRIK